MNDSDVSWGTAMPMALLIPCTLLTSHGATWLVIPARFFITFSAVIRMWKKKCNIFFNSSIARCRLQLQIYHHSNRSKHQLPLKTIKLFSVSKNQNHTIYNTYKNIKNLVSNILEAKLQNTAQCAWLALECFGASWVKNQRRLRPERLLPSSNSFSVGASRQIMLGGCLVLKRSFCASCKSCNSLVVSSSFRWTRKASVTYRNVTQVRVRPDTSHWQPQHQHTHSSLLAHVEHNAFIFILLPVWTQSLLI